MTYNKFELVEACVQLVKNEEQVKNYAMSKGHDADQKIREAFFEIMGTEKPTRKDIRRHKVEIFEIIEEVLTETYLNGVNEDEFFMQFAEVKNLALGDTNEFYVEDTAVLTVSEHSAGHWNIDRQKVEGGTFFPVKVKSYAIAVYGDFYLFLTGRLSFGKLVAKVAQAVQNKIYEEVAASFASTTAQLPTEFKESGNYAEDVLQKLYAHVEAVSGSAVVVGTRAAISKVMAGANSAMFTEAMKGEMNAKGYVGIINGMNVAQLPTVHKKNTFEFAYNDAQLLVLPANGTAPIKLIFEGDDEMKETTDNTKNVDMSFDYSFITRFGCATVFDGGIFGVYDLI